MRFEVSEKKFGKIGVLDTQNTDELLLVCERKSQAGVICDILNDMQQQIDEKPLDLHKDFEMWDKHIQSLASIEKSLVALKQFRDKEEMRILNEVDFKEVYGKNNETIRRNHIKNELADVFDKINSLELELSDRKRKISCIQRMIDMKIQLLGVGVR